jgi:hypothetical protein
MNRSTAIIATWRIDAPLTHNVIKAYQIQPGRPQIHSLAIAEENPNGQTKNAVTKSPMARLMIRTSFG